MPAGHDPRIERTQTDTSLRTEREKADHELAAIEETADAIIVRARARADDVLGAARRRADQQAAAVAGRQVEVIVARERVREDGALRDERATADLTLKQERDEQMALLSGEREATDKDLSAERARADDALANRDEFLGVVSHDLRNMLDVISGFAALIAKEAAAEHRPDQVLRHAQRIQRSGVRMTRLIGDLVDLASIDAGRQALARQLGDPAQVVAEAVDVFQTPAAAGGVSLRAEVPEGSSTVAYDPARILQVLSNLLSNALKFTPANGTVLVRLERLGADVLVTVSDTGSGIPSHMLETIFERFRQVTTDDRRGLGLGLYISKAIVEGHGGRIWAESTAGQGSTFSFTLPVHEPSDASDPADAAFRERRQQPRA